MRIVSAAVFLIALLVALNLAYSVPFYFSWDMDLTTVLDLFRINDGKIPTHINHPGLGFYWVFAWIQKPALWLELITPLNMSTLGTSLEPILIVAEHMEFLRGANAFVCILIPLVAFAAIVPKAVDRVLSFLALTSFLTVPGLWRYNVFLIRTETVSLLFWFLSLLFAVRAASVKSNKWNPMISGFFATLSFFTKIQSLFLVAMVPLIYWLLVYRQDDERETVTPKLNSWPLLVMGISFLAISMMAIGKGDPTYIETFTDFYAPNKFAVLFLGLLIALFAFNRIKIRNSRNLQSAGLIGFFLNWFVMGTAAVLVVPFLLLFDLRTSFEYGLLNFKMIFLRWTRFGSLGEIPIVDNFTSVVQSHFAFLGLFLATAIGLTYSIRGLKRKRQLFGIAVGLFALMSLHILLGVRARLQDGIWVELPILTFVILFLVYFVTRKTVKCAVAACTLAINLAHVSDRRIPESPFPHYDSHVFFEEVYTFNSYWDIMLPRYTSRNQKDQAIDFSLNWRRWRNLVFNNYPASGLDLRDVSYIESSLEPVVSLRRVQKKRINLRYRPDISQFLLFKNGVGDLETAPCVRGEKVAIKWRGDLYVGHEILGSEADRPFPFVCELASDSWFNALFFTRQVAVSTYRNPKLRMDPPAN
jgi:hypothetical protein